MTKHKIDITRPQDYMFRGMPDLEIKEIINNPNFPHNSEYPLIINFITPMGRFDSIQTTINGFYDADEDGTSVFDIILRPGLVAFEAAPEVKRRKVVQVATMLEGEYSGIVALCDDGKIYSSWNNNNWVEWKNVPQD